MCKIKETYEKLRDLFEASQGDALWDDERDDYKYECYDELRDALYEGMKETGTLDLNFLEHVPKRNGTGYYMFAYLGMKNEYEDFTSLQACYTALTFVVRAKYVEHLFDMFPMFTRNGRIYRALSRVCDLLK